MHKPFYRRQRGSMLIEALISMLVFSIGIVSIVHMHSASVTLAGDAKLRSDAALLSEQIVNIMWADKRSNLPSYAHRSAGSLCHFNGVAAPNAAVTAWLGSAAAAGTVAGTLPGTSASSTQIVIGADNGVRVTVCWKTTHDAVPHNHVLATQINGGM
jgi:type IV pilus assembly protein PilV